MDARTLPVSGSDSEETRPLVPPPCPACGGALLLLRGFWRCPRCQYRICEECEGGSATD
jgi:hypothetical protein